jgi:hypothetical protein
MCPSFLGVLIMPGLLSNYWWFFILLGVFAGVVSGMLGLGSGAVVVPVLVLFCGFAQKSAQGTALAVMVPMTLLGAWRYWKNPEIEMNLVVVLLIALGALVGVLAGTEIAARLQNQTLRKAFAVFLAIVAIKMFTASPTPREPNAGGDMGNRNNMSVVEFGDKE